MVLRFMLIGMKLDRMHKCFLGWMSETITAPPPEKLHHDSMKCRGWHSFPCPSRVLLGISRVARKHVWRWVIPYAAL